MTASVLRITHHRRTDEIPQLKEALSSTYAAARVDQQNDSFFTRNGSATG